MSSSRDHRKQLYEQLVGEPVADGKFVITRLLGFGGMGAVYEAVQQNMNRKVALKLIPTHDPTIVARFEREALTISKLQHPNTITVFDFGQSQEGFLFLSMELLDGKTLTEVIESGPIPAARAVHIAGQICRSLAEAHRSGIVHRDIKPDNIILIQVDDDPDVVKVLDFGIAKAVMGDDDVQLTGDGRIIGTPRYMSPEQILAETLDNRSDIYSLGCIIFEMLCGAPPFQQATTTALMISHTQDPPPSFSAQLPQDALDNIPRDLERVVRKALAKAPQNRHASCDQLREELEAALAGTLGGADDEYDEDPTDFGLPSQMMNGQTAALPGAESTGGGSKFLVAGIAALVVVIVGMVAIGALRGGDEPAVEPIAEQPPVEEKPPLLDPTTEETGEPVVAEVAPKEADAANEPTKEDAPGVVSVKVVSTPEGAKVYDGELLLGETPVTLPLPAELKQYAYRLVKDGYKPQTVAISVNPKLTEQEFKYSLERQRTRKPVTKTTTKKPPQATTKPNVTRLEDEKPKAAVDRID